MLDNSAILAKIVSDVHVTVCYSTKCRNITKYSGGVREKEGGVALRFLFTI